MSSREMDMISPESCLLTQSSSFGRRLSYFVHLSACLPTCFTTYFQLMQLIRTNNLRWEAFNSIQTVALPCNYFSDFNMFNTIL